MWIPTHILVCFGLKLFCSFFEETTFRRLEKYENHTVPMKEAPEGLKLLDQHRHDLLGRDERPLLMDFSQQLTLVHTFRPG